MNSAFRTLVEAARLAPSGDNTQPWKFAEGEHDGEIMIMVDPKRDTSPMNAGQRMARIAVGAAVENLCRTAGYNRWPCEVLDYRWQWRVPQCDPKCSVTLRVSETEGEGEIDEAVLHRASNRTRYDGRPIEREKIAQLERLQTSHDAIRIQWVFDRTSIEKLAIAIARADAVMFGDPEFFRAFLKNVRFNAHEGEPALEGLPASTLGLSLAERCVLRYAAALPDWLLSSPMMRLSPSVKARRLVRSAAGICLIVAEDREPVTDYLVGRAFERAWLEMTSAGLAVQPMMSIPVLDNWLENDASTEMTARVQRFHDAIVGLPLLAATGRVAAILRFGYAPTPAARAGRLPVDSIVTVSPCCTGS